MSKHIFLIRGSKAESHLDFKGRVGKALKKIKDFNEVDTLSFTISNELPPRISIIPLEKKKIASISVKMKNHIHIKEIYELTGFSGEYEVREELPVYYTKTWENGEQSPGVCLLTLFKQKKGISYDKFIDRWHNSHTPLSLKYHPLWHYSRNVVEDCKGNSEGWQGIVEEHTRTRSELLNPFKFFGNPLVIIQRMLNVYIDTKSFIDYNTMETYLVNEYHLK